MMSSNAEQILQEGAEPLAALAAVAGEGRGGPRKTATLTKWATVGVRGVLLAAYHDGCRWYSSRPALARFLAQLTRMEREAVERANAPKPTKPARRKRALEVAREAVRERTPQEIAERAAEIRREFWAEMKKKKAAAQ